MGKYFIQAASKAGFTILSLDRQRDASPLAEQLIGQLENSDLLSATLRKFQPDNILHFASQSSIQDSWLDPGSTISKNLEMTRNLVSSIQTMRKSPRFINISSSSVYARKSLGRLKETDLLGPDNPYSISKFAGELTLRPLHSVLTVRPFFIIGPGKIGDVVSDWCRQIVQLERRNDSESLNVVVGNLDIVRDFLPVASAVQGLLLLIVDGISGETYNLCSGQSFLLRDVLEAIRSLSKVQFTVLENSHEKARKNDRLKVVGDPTKIVNLGFQSSFQLLEVLNDTLNWHRINYRFADHT